MPALCRFRFLWDRQGKLNIMINNNCLGFKQQKVVEMLQTSWFGFEHGKGMFLQPYNVCVYLTLPDPEDAKRHELYWWQVDE